MGKSYCSFVFVFLLFLFFFFSSWGQSLPNMTQSRDYKTDRCMPPQYREHSIFNISDVFRSLVCTLSRSWLSGKHRLEFVHRRLFYSISLFTRFLFLPQNRKNSIASDLAVPLVKIQTFCGSVPTSCRPLMLGVSWIHERTDVRVRNTAHASFCITGRGT